MKISSGSGPRAESEGEGWIPNIGVAPAYRGKKDLLLRSGQYLREDELREYWWRWELEGTGGDIIKWRPYGNP